MANYQELKQAIADVIKTNGNQEITGQIMQNVLFSIINQVGKNATFAGMATPGTTPGTPDGNVFYLATVPGSYPNFGGAQVEDGELTFLRWSNGQWYKDFAKLQPTLVFDAKPIEGSKNPVYSGGVYKAIAEQKEQVDAARDEALQQINERGQELILIFNTQKVTPEMLSEETKQYINASGGGTITNLPDGEDIMTTGGDAPVLKFANKKYIPGNFSGSGRVFLRKNIVNGKNVLTQDMIPIDGKNTIYIIQYDYDLNSSTITIPENCILRYEGGSLNNGNIVGDFTSFIFNYKYSNTLNVTRINIAGDANSVYNILSLNDVLIKDGVVNVDNQITIDGKSGNAKLDFKNVKFKLKNNAKNKIKITNFNNLVISNLSVIGDSINDSSGKPYNTDASLSAVLISEMNNVVLKDSFIGNVRGKGVDFLKCKNCTVINTNIEKSTYTNIGSDSCDYVSFINCTLIGLGDRGSVEENKGYGAGISINAGYKAYVRNNIIKGVSDTAIQCNGFVYSYLLYNIIDGFGKDGIKAMRSPVFDENGVSEYALLQGNVIMRKFEGKSDGSFYIGTSDVLCADIKDNYTIGGVAPKDNGNDYNWSTCIYQVRQSIKADAKRSCSIINNVFHSKISLHCGDNIIVTNNKAKLFEIVGSPDYGCNIDSLDCSYNSFENELSNSYWVFNLIGLVCKNCAFGHNNINIKSTILYCTNCNFDDFVFSDNVIVTLQSLFVLKATETDFGKIKKMEIKNNKYDGFTLPTGFYSPISTSGEIHIDLYVVRNNVFTTTRPTQLDIDGTEYSIDNCISENNMVNESMFYLYNTRMKGLIKRYINKVKIKFISSTMPVIPLAVQGDAFEAISAKDRIECVFNGVNWYSDSVIYTGDDSPFSEILHITRILDGKRQIYNGSNWVDDNGYTKKIIYVGTTSQRPTTEVKKGFVYFDISKNIPIWWTGNKWVKADGMDA